MVNYRCMRKRKRPFLFLLVSFLSFMLGGYIVYYLQPNASITFFLIKLPVLPVFFFLLFAFLFSFTAYMLRSKLQGILVASFACIYLLIRMFGFTALFFQILLLALFIATELFFLQNTNKPRKQL